MGNAVRVLVKICSGATCSVFLVLTALNELRVYKVARISGMRQFEAVQKAIELIWDTAEATTHLLLATVGVCKDPRYYFISSPLLDSTTGRRCDLNCYNPKTLSAWLNSLRRCANGALSKKDALDLLGYLVAALESLGYLHDHGLVYNDVHPGNCGFHDNRLVWIDYSAITFLREQPHEGCSWYEAPEGREATPAHDCFSLVKMLIEALSGVHPAAIQPIAISDICGKYFTGSPFAEAVRSIACKGLSVDPTQRYQSTSELRDDLQHAKQLLEKDIV